jgi:sugar lactone lactonase YvrE
VTRAIPASLAALALPALLSATAAADFSHAARREPLGPPQAPHAMPGVDARRSRRATSSLAASPRVERRLRVAYGVGRGLVTRDDGGFLVLHPSARASRFDAQGKLVYSLKLPTEASSAPAATSNGNHAWVARGSLMLVGPTGHVRARAELGDADFSARSILATSDGGVVVGSSSRLVKLSAAGELVWQRPAPASVLELLETAGQLWCVTATGLLYRLDGAGRATKLADLGGTTQSVATNPRGNVLLARTGNHRLIAYDLVEHRALGVIEDGTLDLEGPVLFTAEGAAQAFTSDGLLVRYRADGSEEQRIPFDPGARKAPGPEDALLLGDGRLLVARAGADVVMVLQSGEVSAIAGSSCPDPVGLFAQGPHAVLLACRSGNMLRLE